MNELEAVDVTAWAVVRLDQLDNETNVIVEGIIIGPYEDAVKLRSQLIDESGKSGDREVRESYIIRSTFVFNYVDILGRTIEAWFGASKELNDVLEVENMTDVTWRNAENTAGQS